MSWKSLLIGSVAALMVARMGFAQVQQDARPLFVPNELTIVYNSPKDAEDALAKFRQSRGGPRVRGAPVTGLDATRTRSDTLTLRFPYPDEILPRVRGNPTSELELLEELAQSLQDADPNIKLASPVWIRFNPPNESGGPGNELKFQTHEPGLNPPGTRDFVLGKDGPAVGVAGAPNDPFFALQWDYLPPPVGMNAIGAWKATQGSPDVVVAIIDTGILPDHPDIKQAGHVQPGMNFVSSRFREKLFCNDEPGWGANGTDPGDDREQCRALGSKPDAALLPSFHGTHVAGTIGAVGTDNNLGIAGIARSVTILPLRVLTSSGGRDPDIFDAMRWAAGLRVEGLPPNQHPADIINMSLGGPNIRWDKTKGQLVFATCDKDSPFKEVIDEVRQKGTVIVVAAGNGEWQTQGGGVCIPGSPGCTRRPIDAKYENIAGCPGVISVAASDMRGRLAPYSNYGAVSIMAPGGNVADHGNIVDPQGEVAQENAPYGGVLSTLKGAQDYSYVWYQGTSMAAPHVAGAIALMLAAHPELRRKPDLIEQAVRASAVPAPKGACPADKPCGPGLLDAAVLVGPQHRKPSPF